MPSCLDALIRGVRPVDWALEPHARRHLDSLTKPPGSLGRLEDLAAQMYCIQGGAPQMDPARIYTIGGDHGVHVEGVSPSVQAVTRQMMANFLSGGGGINALTDVYGIDFKAVDAGCLGGPFPEHPRLIQRKIAEGTDNLAAGPAMSRENCIRAILLGADLAAEARAEGYRTLGTGEMGVANTTPSTALYCAFFGMDPEELTGPGAGLCQDAAARKADVIRTALALHAPTIAAGQPLDILAALGGYEIAALAGLILGGAAQRLVLVVDGFISSAAYVAAWKMCPAVAGYCVFSHASAEPGHRKAMQAMQANPLLDLGMRLGEGTGAAVAMSLLRGAAHAYNAMATFDDAGVTEVEDPFAS